MIILRPDQQQLIEEVRNAFRDGHKNVVIQLATGGGKTFTAGSMLGQTVQRGKKSFFLCNRIELIEQTSASFDKLGIPHGIIAAGHPYQLHHAVQIGSIDTLKVRLDDITFQPDLIVWDECRGLGAAGWKKIYDHYPKAFHIGLDATPVRNDGQGLGKFFTHMVQGLSIKQLIELGALVPPRIYAPDNIDLSSVSIKAGDYDTEELENAMDKPSITGSAIDHYLKYGEGRQGIIFTVSIKHSKSVTDQFNMAGITCAHVDANTLKKERKKIIEDYRKGQYLLLSNVNLFTAGFDVPNVSYIAGLRPTKSLPIFLQQCGRAARPCGEKKDYVLMDHACNVKRFGFPHADREWSLDAKKIRKNAKKSEETIELKQCPECYLCHDPVFTSCPECGHIYEAKPRNISEIDGELKEVVEEQKIKRKMEVKDAKSLEDLLVVASQRGYKAGWAHIMWGFKRGQR